MQHITIAGSKGGTGTTTFTAGLALELARRGQLVRVYAHDIYSLRDILGVGYVDDDVVAFDLFGTGSTMDSCKVHRGTPDDDGAIVLHDLPAGTVADITVVRNDYPSLAAAHRMGSVTVAVVMVESGRALSSTDAHTCLAVPCFDVPVDPTVARSVDAGLFTSRTPRVFATAVAAVADRYVAPVVAS